MWLGLELSFKSQKERAQQMKNKQTKKTQLFQESEIKSPGVKIPWMSEDTRKETGFGLRCWCLVYVPS